MNVLSLMISCPSDVSDEVKTIEDVVRTINNTIGLSAGFVIRTLFWKECVIPTAGKSAQDIINEQVLSRADAVIGTDGDRDVDRLIRKVWELAEHQVFSMFDYGVLSAKRK